MIRSEDMFRSPSDVYARVLTFLGLPAFQLPMYEVQNRGGYRSIMSESLRRTLHDYFEPHNRRLCELLGWESAWDD